MEFKKSSDLIEYEDAEGAYVAYTKAIEIDPSLAVAHGFSECQFSSPSSCRPDRCLMHLQLQQPQPEC